MESHLPRFSVATLVDESPRLRSRIGGIPFGLPADRWPSCCDAPQKLLAQLCHEPPAIDLGSDRYVLYLFQCLECCGIDEDGCGAVVVRRDELADVPVTVQDYDQQPELGETLIGELFIDGWKSVEDGIPQDRLPDFFDEMRLWTLRNDYPEIEWFDEMTRFGGSPRWTGNGPSPPPAGFEFLGQLDTSLFIEGPPPPEERLGCPVQSEGPLGGERTKPNAPWSAYHEPGSDHYSVECTNLGSDGTAFIFINRSPEPRAVWFWNR